MVEGLGGEQHKLSKDVGGNDDGLEMPFGCINAETLKIAPPCPLGYRFYCLWTDRQDGGVQPDNETPPRTPTIRKQLYRYGGGWEVERLGGWGGRTLLKCEPPLRGRG